MREQARSRLRVEIGLSESPALWPDPLVMYHESKYEV